MIKAAFFDVDGTLVSSETRCISDALLEDLAALRQRGIKLFLATGRAKPDLVRTGMLKTAAFDAYVTLGGTYCYNDKGLYRDIPLCREDLANACQVLKEHPYLAARYEAGYVTGLNQINDRVRRLDAFMHIPLYEIHPPEWMLERNIYQFVPLVDKAEEDLFLSVMPRSSSTRWHEEGLDVLPAGDGKADGIKATLDLYGLRKDEIIAFGDGENDLSMLELSGISVAMGNSIDEVKDTADFVTDSVENDGICQALRHFGLL